MFHMGRFTWAVSHGHHHARICGFGTDMSGVAVEPVVQQLRCNCRLLGGVQIDGVVSCEHGLSAEAGRSSVVVETAVQQFGLGLGAKREVRGGHWKC